MDIELEKGLQRSAPLGHHGLRDRGAHCIFSRLGIAAVACGVCTGKLSPGRVGL